MKFRMILTMCLLLISWGAKAHQPDLSSTILVEQGENKWLLQVSASLTAFEYEIEKHYGESSYTSPEEFQKLVVDYVREKVSLQLNETGTAELQNGMVKLGHETSVTFQVEGMPKNIQYITLHNGSFSDISRNKSLVYVLKDGFAKDQFTLTNDNGHTLNLKAGHAKFELLEQKEEKPAIYTWMIVAALVMLPTVGFLVYKAVSTRIHHL